MQVIIRMQLLPMEGEKKGVWLEKKSVLGYMLVCFRVVRVCWGYAGDDQGSMFLRKYDIWILR